VHRTRHGDHVGTLPLDGSQPDVFDDAVPHGADPAGPGVAPAANLSEHSPLPLGDLCELGLAWRTL
jgi:hypothetical protein